MNTSYSDPTSTSIDVASEFCDTLTESKSSKSNYSAAKFRNSILIPALNNYQKVTLILTDVKECTRSFLNEVFYKLDLSKYGYDELQTKLSIISPKKDWENYVWSSLEQNYFDNSSFDDTSTW